MHIPTILELLNPLRTEQLWQLKETRVRNAVKMGWITEEEFTEITGNDY